MMERLRDSTVSRRPILSLVFPVVLGTVAGVPGVVVGGLAGIVWVRGGPVVGFLIAQFGLLLTDLSLEMAILVASILAIPLVVRLWTAFELRRRQWAIIAGLTGAVLVSLTWLVYAGPWTLFISTLIGLGVLSVVLYGIHRYEILRLGLVPEEST